MMVVMAYTPPAFTYRSTDSCPGSAMIELAYDIAPGANFKFNTAFMGEKVRMNESAFTASVSTSL